MKENQNNLENDTGMAQEIDFNDWAIDRLYIKSEPRKDYRFRNVKVPYLKGLNLKLAHGF